MKSKTIWLKYYLILTSLITLHAHGATTLDNPAITIQIDAASNRHPINPMIYGVNFADSATLMDLGAPLNRQGGNAATRYNWQLNASNRAADFYFESIGEASATPAQLGDSFVEATKSVGAEPMITIPLIDWVAKLGPNRGKLASFSQAKYGRQTGNDSAYFPDAGNGILAANNQNVTGNDPNDAHVPNSSNFQQGWVQHMVNMFTPAEAGGVVYYVLDNEHSIWFATHRDVHPVGPTMDEIKQKIIDYASAIKRADPSAQVVGPEEWGWSGFLLSGYDQQWGAQHGWSGPLPDRTNHGNQDYMPWLLSQLHQNEVTTGKRLLDVFSLHFYPQGGEFGNDTSQAMQLLRNKSTRSLWDPQYVDSSWINDKVMLIPRMKGWLASNYPGLKTAITEYNWGAENHINGATTQADILGIFGREGLDMATRWTTPAASTPTYKAMKMYRNVDGLKSGFGETSVAASVPNPDNLSGFAAVRGRDGSLTVMVINKVLSGNTPVTLNLAHFTPGSKAQVWQLSASNSISRLPDVVVSGGQLASKVPAQSVTLFVIPSATPVHLRQR